MPDIGCISCGERLTTSIVCAACTIEAQRRQVEQYDRHRREQSDA